MSRIQKILLGVFLTGILGLILLTWGSIGSAVLTLALLLGLGMILMQKFLESRDPDDFKWDE